MKSRGGGVGWELRKGLRDAGRHRLGEIDGDTGAGNGSNRQSYGTLDLSQKESLWLPIWELDPLDRRF